MSYTYPDGVERLAAYYTRHAGHGRGQYSIEYELRSLRLTEGLNGLDLRFTLAQKLRILGI